MDLSAQASRWKAEIWIAVSIAVLAVLAVSAASGAQSFGHMYDWAIRNGEPHWRAVLFPVSIDGMIVAATAILYVDHRLDRAPHKLAFVLLAVGAIVSVVANVLHDWVAVFAGKAISGIGPLALFGSVHLTMQFIRSLVTLWSAPAASATVRDAAPVPATALWILKVPERRIVLGPAPKPKPSPKPKVEAKSGPAPVKSGPDSAPVVDDVLLQRARHADRDHAAKNGGRPISRDALKDELKIGTGKATELLAVLKSEREVA